MAGAPGGSSDERGDKNEPLVHFEITHCSSPFGSAVRLLDSIFRNHLEKRR